MNVPTRALSCIALAGVAALAISPMIASAAKACTEVSCAATYGGERLTGVDNIQYNGDLATSWQCHYADGTTLTVSCT